ncbi:MAG: hypothetical protein M3063_09990 [Actinomycetota bacterium]|nr:hypothetical protein [Actinomycetota bacterium]
MSPETEPHVAPSHARAGPASIRRRARGVVAVCLGVGFVVGAVVASAAQGSPTPVRVPANVHEVVATVPGPPAPSGGPAPLLDRFDRADDPAALGTVSGGPPWRPLAGIWGIANQQAYLSAPPGGSGLAMIDVGRPVAATEVRLADVETGAGLVFAFQDPSDYWAVEAAPGYGTWNVVEVVQGVVHSRGNVGLVPTAAGTVVTATMSAATVNVAIDGQAARTLSDPALGSSTEAGLVVSGASATMARFEDFGVTPVAA